MDYTVNMVGVRGAALEYIDTGAGDALVLLHGALGDWRTWAPHTPVFAANWRTLAYSQRYFGHRAWADGPPFGVATHSEDLIAFIETVDAAPARIVAWSYAGHVALHAALQRPDLFADILIYEPGFPTYVTDPAYLAAFQQDADALFGPVAAAPDHAEAARRLIDGSAAKQGYYDRLSSERRRIIMENAHTMPRLLAQAPPPNITRENLASLQTRVSIAWGEATRPMFQIVSRAAAQAIDKGAHAIAPRVGHMWVEDEPLAFARFASVKLFA